MNTYFDNASTSFPKPAQVAEQITWYLNTIGGTYGRAAYGRIVAATSLVEQCRDLLAVMLGTKASEQVVFCANATTGANVVLKGCGLNLSHTVLVSAMEHNAVMRPLHFLSEQPNALKQYKVLPALQDGTIDLDKLYKQDLDGVHTLIVNHVSNVNGMIQPMNDISAWAKQKGVRLVVDASQSLGQVPVEGDRWHAAHILFTGHKALLGPTGIGGFWGGALVPLVHGGTGSNSDSYNMPEMAPDSYEAGTPNITGIVGLLAALKHRPAPLHTHSDLLDCMNEIAQIPGITLYRANNQASQSDLFSFTHQQLTPSVLANKLYERHKIEIRSGLHCAPLAHRTLGTFPAGTVRVALAPYHTPDDLVYLIKAIRDVVQ